MNMLAKKAKKGFTIVELVIVIAVIAILAAVLIPTFASVISSANESSDIQATKNMNTALYSEEILNGKPSNLAEAKEVLSEAGYSDDLYPATNNYHWYWNSYYNIVMLINDTDGWELIYPQTDDAGNAYTQYLSYCYNINYPVSATQTILLDAISSGEGTITVKTASASTSTGSDIVSNAGWEDLVSLANNVGTDFSGVTVKLDSDITITETNPIYEFNGTFDGNSKTVTVSAKAITPEYGENGNGYFYSKVFDSSDSVYKYKYGYGLFASVTGGTIKNLNVVYSDTSAPKEPGNEYTYFGGIVGILDGGTIENCTVSGTIIQYNRVGGIVGTALRGTITGCTMTANITSKPVTTSSYLNSSGAVAHSNSFHEYSYAGGIVCYAGDSTSDAGNLYITNCDVGGNTAITINASGWGVGGYVAWVTKGENVTISGGTIKNVTVSSGETKGQSYIGIICGAVMQSAYLTLGGSDSSDAITLDSGLTNSGTTVTSSNAAAYVSGYNSGVLVIVGIPDSTYTNGTTVKLGNNSINTYTVTLKS